MRWSALWPAPRRRALLSPRLRSAWSPTTRCPSLLWLSLYCQTLLHVVFVVHTALDVGRM